MNTLESHREGVLSVAFSPDGAMLATTSEDNTVKLWAVATGALLNTLEGHSDRVLSAAFSPDGNALATTSADATAKIWMLNPDQLARWNCEWLRGYLAHSLEGQQAAKAGICDRVHDEALINEAQLLK